MNPLIFRWPERSASLLLPGFFLLVVAIHAGAFYLFQVVYPPTAAIAPPPAYVTLISPDTAEHRAFLAWLDDQAPRPVAIPGAPQPVARYTPSWAAMEGSFHEATNPLPAGAGGGVTWPSGTLPRQHSLPPPVDTPARPALPTRLQLAPALEGRVAQRPKALPLYPKKGSHLPTVYLIGVDAQGRLAHRFLHASSGDPALDAAAGVALRGVHFREAPGAELVWGEATFLWGAPAPLGKEGAP